MFLNASRADFPELIDGADFSPEEFGNMLREIEIINRLTNGYGPTIDAIASVAGKYPHRRLRVLDIGSGAGDTLRAVRRWADRQGLELDLVGIDINPFAQKHAEACAGGSRGIRYLTGDIFRFEEADDFDIMINALFMHHLDDVRIPFLLRWMTERARLAWFINDLHRHAIAYHFIKLATRALGFGRLVRHDGPLSVAKSFRRRDWKLYLEQAGIPVACVSIRWHLSFRYGVFCDTAQLRARKSNGGRQSP